MELPLTYSDSLLSLNNHIIKSFGPELTLEIIQPSRCKSGKAGKLHNRLVILWLSALTILFSVNAQGSVRYNTQPFFRDQLTTYPAHAVDFVLNPEEGVLEVLHKLSLAIGEVVCILVCHSRCSIIKAFDFTVCAVCALRKALKVKVKLLTRFRKLPVDDSTKFLQLLVAVS